MKIHLANESVKAGCEEKADKAIHSINAIGDALWPLFRILSHFVTKHRPDLREFYILHTYYWIENIHKNQRLYFKVTEEEIQEIIARKAQEARLAELHTMPYRAYLQTPEWQERRKRILERDGYKCLICNSSEHLNVHHRTYERRGYEDDRDLTVLCADCHQIFHENGNLAEVE